jgi:hypothetical protein
MQELREWKEGGVEGMVAIVHDGGLDDEIRRDGGGDHDAVSDRDSQLFARSLQTVRWRRPMDKYDGKARARWMRE